LIDLIAKSFHEFLANKSFLEMVRCEGLAPIFLGVIRKFRDELLRRLGLLKPKSLELEVLRILSTIRSVEVFVDVGAFEGIYSLFCAQRGCTVFAFEPNPATFERLSKRLSKHWNVVCYNLALGDKKESKDLYMPENAPDQSSMSILQKHERIKAIKANVERLDDFHNIHPDVMKIDVEGYGYNVLLGSCETLDVYHPQIILEFHSIEEYKRCKDYLEGKGYVVKLLDYWKDHGHIYAYHHSRNKNIKICSMCVAKGGLNHLICSWRRFWIRLASRSRYCLVQK
jgi:FkbM family methyltransferase